MVLTVSGMLTSARDVQSQKVLWPIVFNDGGRRTLTREVQLEKMLLPREVIDEGNSISTSELHSLNALSPMLIKLFDKINFFNDLHPLKNPSSIVFIEAKSDNSSRLEQSLNGYLPSDVTDDGITALESEVHPEKAWSPIVSIFSGRLISKSDSHLANA